MKKLFWIFPLLSAFLFSAGCKLPPVILPLVQPTPTPTATSTIVPPTTTPMLTATPFPTFVPMTPIPTPTIPPGSVCGLNVITIPSNTYPTNLAALQVPDANFPSRLYTVIRSYADWQDWCGTLTPPAPPVDFATNMILQTFTISGCTGTSTLDNVCVSPTEVMIFTTFHPMQLLCNYITMVPIALSIPQNTLPIVTY